VEIRRKQKGRRKKRRGPAQRREIHEENKGKPKKIKPEAMDKLKGRRARRQEQKGEIGSIGKNFCQGKEERGKRQLGYPEIESEVKKGSGKGACNYRGDRAKGTEKEHGGTLSDLGQSEIGGIERRFWSRLDKELRGFHAEKEQELDTPKQRRRLRRKKIRK